MLESLKKESKRWLKALRANDGGARLRFVRLHPTPPASPALRDVQLALARERGFAGWAELKAELAAQPPRDAAHVRRVQWFLENACPDHHVRGRASHARAESTAMRLLARYPEIAHDSFCTEVVCGNEREVERLLTRRPLAVSALCETPDPKREEAASDDWLKDLGPKGWQPLLYLCSTRLPLPSVAENSAAIGRMLLDRGADPNVATTEGESPLDWAIYNGDRAKIQVLEEHGAKRGNGPRREEIPPPEKGGIGDSRLSLTRSVARLFDAAPGFREKTNCISCHHNAMPALTAATVRRKGIDVDETRTRKNLDDILSFFKSNAPRMMLGDPAVGGEALTTGYAQMALAAEGYPLDSITATMTHWLIARQMPDGRWLGNGLNRPPSEYSTISHTAIAAGGLKSYSIPGRKNEAAASLQRARDWLLAAEPRSTEERSMRLMGLVWTGAPRPRVAAAIAEVRNQQEPGGGWSQFARTDPDAYATGLSLYALHVAGVPPTDAAYRKGVAFLLGTQYQDGAWLVKTHSFPVQRYFESGFPFGRHQWISAAGTSWASLAIAQTLPDAPADRRPSGKRP